MKPLGNGRVYLLVGYEKFDSIAICPIHLCADQNQNAQRSHESDRRIVLGVAIGFFPVLPTQGDVLLIGASNP